MRQHLAMVKCFELQEEFHIEVSKYGLQWELTPANMKMFQEYIATPLNLNESEPLGKIAYQYETMYKLATRN